jgi:hypothetical protein
MEDAAFAHLDAIAAATAVLDRHLAALNSGDTVALAQTLRNYAERTIMLSPGRLAEYPRCSSAA